MLHNTPVKSGADERLAAGAGGGSGAKERRRPRQEARGSLRAEKTDESTHFCPYFVLNHFHFSLRDHLNL